LNNKARNREELGLMNSGFTDKEKTSGFPSPENEESAESTSRMATTKNRKNTGIFISKLSEISEKTMLNQRAMAEIFCVSKRTIRRMVSRFEIPPPVHIGGQSMWVAGKVIEHIEAQAERLARDAKRRADKLKRVS